MSIRIKGDVPPNINEIALNKLLRLALAVGVGSSFNFTLTEVNGYASDLLRLNQEGEIGLPRKLTTQSRRVLMGLSKLLVDAIELEERTNAYLEEIGAHYEVTDT